MVLDQFNQKRMAETYGHEQRHVINGFRIAALLAEALDETIDAINPIEDEDDALQKAEELKSVYQEWAKKLQNEDYNHTLREPLNSTPYPPIGSFPPKPTR